MADIIQQQQNLLARSAAVAAAQAQAASQSALRQQTGLEGMRQRQIQQAQVKAAEGQIAQEQKGINEIIALKQQEAKKQQEAQAALELKQRNYEEGYNRALEEGSKSTYIGNQTPEYQRGYLEAKKSIAAEQARYGGPLEALKYGTPTEKARVESAFFPELKGKEYQVDLKKGEVSYMSTVKPEATTLTPQQQLFSKYSESAPLPQSKEERKGFVEGLLGYLGAKVGGSKYLREVAGSALLVSTAATSKPSLITDKKASESFLKTSVPASGTALKMTAETAPYFIPVVGEGLLIGGGAEKVIRAKSFGEAALGVREAGLGTFAGLSRLKSLKQISDIKGATTSFIGEEQGMKDASLIRIVSKTQVGKTPYLGFTKQVVLDKNIPALGEVRLGASRGLTITGTNKVYPITFIEPRIQPIKELFVAKEAGVASRVLSGEGYKVGTEAGEGIFSSAAIKKLSGGYSKAEVAGGFKPMQEEGFSQFIGGDKPIKVISISKEGISRVIRTKPNIKGIVQQISTPSEEFTGGGQVFSKSKQLPKFTQERIIESVGQQREAALDIAKTQAQKTESLAKTSETTGGLTSSLGLRTKQKTEVVPKLEVKTEEVTKTRPKLETLSLQAPRTQTSLRTEITPLSDTSTDTLSRTEVLPVTQLASASMLRAQTPMPSMLAKAKANIFPPSEDKRKAKSLLITISKSKLFRVLSRRKGKWFEIAKGLPERKAKLAGVKYTRRTLARSFKLEEAGLGDVQDITFEVPKALYRAPKGRSQLPKNTYVQIKALSRGTGEVGEILSAKKNKRRRLKWI